jgi:hypothetical protein
MSCILRAPSSSSRDDPPEMLTPSTFQGTHRVLPQFHHGWQDGRPLEHFTFLFKRRWSATCSDASPGRREHGRGWGERGGRLEDDERRDRSGRWGAATTTGARGPGASG